MNNIDTLMQKIERGRCYRDMEVRAAGEGDQLMVEGYATTFDDPYLLWREPGYKIYEIIDRHALDEADQSDVIMQYDHEGRVFARLSNRTLELATDDHGYKMRANLGGTDIGRQLYQEIAGGYTTKMSWAFRVKDDDRKVERNEDTGEITVTRRILTVSKVYDVSAVSLPANDATEISARSYCDGVIAELKEERRRAEAEIAARAATIAKIKLLSEV